LKHPAVSWVNYPGLPSHPSHKLAEKYLQGNYSDWLDSALKAGMNLERNSSIP
jgi:O-acetylhomoserine (thiol)-lyase